MPVYWRSNFEVGYCTCLPLSFPPSMRRSQRPFLTFSSRVAAVPLRFPNDITTESPLSSGRPEALPVWSGRSGGLCRGPGWPHLVASRNVPFTAASNTADSRSRSFLTASGNAWQACSLFSQLRHVTRNTPANAQKANQPVMFPVPSRKYVNAKLVLCGQDFFANALSSRKRRSDVETRALL